jgi:hypothetical protein
MKRFFHNIKIEKIKIILAHAGREFFATYKKRKRVFAIVFISLFLLIGTGIYFQFYSQKAVAAWWDESWGYRKAIAINNTGAVITNQYEKITLDTSALITAGKMQNDCDDIRITNVAGNVLTHFVDGNPTYACNTTTTSVYVLLDSVPVSGITVYLYYGNSQASNIEPTLGTQDNPAISCKNILQHRTDSKGTAQYYITPTGNLADKIQVTCDMTYSSGGWIKVWHGLPSEAYVDDATHEDLNIGNNIVFNEMRVEGSNLGFNVVDSVTQTAKLGNTIRGYYNQVRLAPDASNPRISFHDMAGSQNVPLVNSYFFYGYGNVYRVFYTCINVAGIENLYLGGYAPACTPRANFDAASVGCGSAGNHYCSTSRTTTPKDSLMNLSLYQYQESAVYVRETAINLNVAQAMGTIASEEKTTGPLSFWKFDEGNGVISRDSAWKKTGSVTNLVSNPSFEGSNALWSSANVTMTQVNSSKAVFGNKYAKVVGDGINQYSRVSYVLGDLPVGNYSIQFRYKADSVASTTGFWDIWAFNPTLVSLAGAGYVNMGIADNNGWVTVKQQFVVASGQSNIQIWYYISAAATSTGTLLLDGVQVESGLINNLYCDGSLTGNGTHTWSGTANASTSICDTGTDGENINTTWRQNSECVAGKCLQFNGANSYVDFGDAPQFNFGTGDFTLSAWVKTTSTANQHIIAKRHGAYGMGYSLGITNGKPYAEIINDSLFVSVDSNTLVNDNKWTYISATYKRDGTLSVYVNGALKNASSIASMSSSNITNTHPLQIGIINNPELAYDAPFAGFIDEPKLYSYARSASQLSSDYSAGLAGMSSDSGASASFGGGSEKWMTDGLVGYWKMDETSGTTSYDASGKGNDLGNNATTSSYTGKYNRAVDFTSSASITSPSTTAFNFGTGDFSVSYWANLRDYTYPKSSVSMHKTDQAYTNGHPGWEFGNGYSTTGYMFAINDGTNKVQAAMPIDVGYRPTDMQNKWAHYVFAVSRATGKVKLYINGVKQSTELDISSVTGSVDNAFTFQIGNINGWYIDGQVDETRMYNRALSPDEVTKLYEFAPAPIAYYDFDNDPSNSIMDKSGNGLNLAKTGAPTYENGKFGNAMKFVQASDDGGNLTNDIFNINDYTYGFWFKLNTANNGIWNTIFALTNDGSSRSPSLWHYQNQDCFHPQENPSDEGFSCAGPTGINSYWTLGQWYYYSQTKKGTTLTYYVNGIQKGTMTVTDPMQNGTNPTLSLGRAMAAGYSAGFTMDEFKIYNYSRTQKQILDDMNAGNAASKEPIAYWKFEEGSGTVANNSGTLGSAQNAALSNMSLPATATSGWTNNGKLGKALLFDGVDDFTTMGTGNDYFPLNTFSLCSWIKTPGLGSGMTLNGILSMTYGLTMYLDAAGKLNTRMDDGVGGPVVSVSGNLADNVWHQTCLTYDGTYRHMFVDGVKKSSTATTWLGVTRWPTNTVNVGQENNNYPLYKFNGTIDEVKIFNYALSSAEIAADYNQGSSVTMASAGISAGAGDNAAKAQYCIPGDASTCNSPVAEWNFDEKTGTTIKDSSGNSYNGTLINGSWTTGKTGSAILYNGTPGSATHINGPDISIATNITAEAWIYSSDYNQNGFIVSKNPVNTQWELFVAANNLYWRSQVDFTNDTVYPAPSVNTWHHIAVTQAGTLTNMYIDGALVASKTTVAIGNSAGNIEIGSYSAGGGYPFKGKIDGVKLYDYARTPAQIAFDYNRGAPVGWWKMDECQGNTIFDASGKGNNGTWTGATGSQTAIGTCETAGTAWGNGKIGKFGSSLNFDTTDDVAMIAGSSSLNNPKAITVSTWVKSNDVTQDQTLVSRNGPFFLRISGSRFRIALYTGVWLFQNGTIPLSSNTWTHLTLTYDGANVKSYVNGVLDISNPKTGDMISMNNLYFGYTPVGGENYPLNGQLDDVRIYNYALTKEQIANVMNEGSALRFGN